MSYEKVKYLSVNRKKNKVFVTSAANNCFPMTFEKWEFCSNDGFFGTKILNLAKSILNGNLQLYPSCPHYALQEDMKSLRRGLSFDPLDEDFRYKTNTSDEVDSFIAKKIAIPYFFKGCYDKLETAKLLETTITESCKKAYAEKDAQDKRQDKLPIKTAWRSDYFAGYDLLIDYEGNIILAKEEDYDNRGTLSNQSKAYHLHPAPTNKDTLEIMMYWPQLILGKFPELNPIKDIFKEK